MNVKTIQFFIFTKKYRSSFMYENGEYALRLENM